MWYSSYSTKLFTRPHIQYSVLRDDNDDDSDDGDGAAACFHSKASSQMQARK